MKFLVSLFLTLAFFPFVSSAQDSLHVSWTASVEKVNGNEVSFKILGKIQPGWHVYTKENTANELSGLLLNINDSGLTNASLDFTGGLASIQDPIFDQQSFSVAKDSIIIRRIFTFEELTGLAALKINYDVADLENFLQEETVINISIGKSPEIKESNRMLIKSIDIQHPLSDCTTSGAVEVNAKTSGLMHIFMLGFLGGLLALLTPCVFPMIPLTVSFFTKKAASRNAGIRNAGLYGFFILLIYLLLSLPFHFLTSLNPEILNNISTNVWLNVIFFAVFVFFAFSFFGFYEITLPAGLSGKADSKAGTGNVIGIFFMALTLSIVSFSCTGPILGSLLAGSLSNDGGAMQLTAGMGGFGLALALPFALFALFPNWLNSLPKSGGWLDTVKKVLGFVELALALKFLSNADLVKHWGILKREIFIGIWIVISLLLTLYFWGILRFKNDFKGAKLSLGRKMLGLITALFTAYLLPGVTNTSYANLELISGFPPPLYYSIYAKEGNCVLNLNCAHDYEEGLAMARREGKPLLIDFTGYACVNCRRMEEKIWRKRDIYKIMKEKYIVVSLYVDDAKNLPVEKRFSYVTKTGHMKNIKTVGDMWSTFETENFSNNSQPWYAIIDNEERLLTHPVGNTPSASEYLDWLQCGWDTFNKYKKP